MDNVASPLTALAGLNSVRLSVKLCACATLLVSPRLHYSQGIVSGLTQPLHSLLVVVVCGCSPVICCLRLMRGLTGWTSQGNDFRACCAGPAAAAPAPAANYAAAAEPHVPGKKELLAASLFGDGGGASSRARARRPVSCPPPPPPLHLPVAPSATSCIAIGLKMRQYMVQYAQPDNKRSVVMPVPTFVQPEVCPH